MWEGGVCGYHMHCASEHQQIRSATNSKAENVWHQRGLKHRLSPRRHSLPSLPPHLSC